MVRFPISQKERQPTGGLGSVHPPEMQVYLYGTGGLNLRGEIRTFFAWFGIQGYGTCFLQFSLGFPRTRIFECLQWNNMELHLRQSANGTQPKKNAKRGFLNRGTGGCGRVSESRLRQMCSGGGGQWRLGWDERRENGRVRPPPLILVLTGNAWDQPGRQVRFGG